MAFSHRPWSLRLLACGVFVWAALGWGRELVRVVQLHDLSRQRPRHLGITWRFTLQPALRMRNFLERTRELLPAGSRVAFSSRQDEGNSDFFRFLWASYLRPDCVWVPAAAARDGQAELWVAYGQEEHREGLSLMHQDNAGSIYRIERLALAAPPGAPPR